MSTRATITFTLTVDEFDTATAEVKAALDSLADVMGVQTEDGLYPLGYEDGIGDGEDNTLLSSISGLTYTVTVDDQFGTPARRDSCKRCSLDIESVDGASWWDRGGDGSCPENIGGFHEPAGA